MEKDSDRWSNLKKITDKEESNMKIRLGEVRWCRVGVNVGKEILGKGETFRRPVLIIKKFSGDVFFGLPLSSKVHKGDWYYRLNSQGVERTVILNQGRVLDRRRLEEKMFELSESELEKIKKAFCDLIMKI